MTKVGFTGTQHGMTDNQKKMVRQLLVIIEGTEFHHGDCVGSDEESADIARELKYVIISHPPHVTEKRAFFNSDFEFEPKDYLERNHDIVDETEILIATPQMKNEKMRSGTWATIRYAKKQSRKIVIINPDGDLEGF